MRINEEQYERIADYFPIQRGNVKTNNRDFINAIYTLTVCPTLGVHIKNMFFNYFKLILKIFFIFNT